MNLPTYEVVAIICSLSGPCDEAHAVSTEVVESSYNPTICSHYNNPGHETKMKVKPTAGQTSRIICRHVMTPQYDKP